MRGKKWLIALIIIGLIGGGFWLWWKAPSSTLSEGVAQKAEKLKPELNVASFNITSIDADKINATATVMLKNNLPLEVKTNKLNYIIYIDSVKVIEDTYNKPVIIKSSGTTSITLPMQVKLDNMKAVIKRFDQQKRDSADYAIKAVFEVEVPVAGDRNFTMNLSKRLPALQPLKVAIKDIDLGKLGLKETGLNMVVNVENPNQFPVKIKNGKYKLSIDNDKNVMEGNMEPVVNIPANGTEAVTMHVDMKTMKVPKLGWKMLFDKKDTHFKMNFNCNLASDNGMLNNSSMAMNMQGTLEDLKDAVKKK